MKSPRLNLLFLFVCILPSFITNAQQSLDPVVFSTQNQLNLPLSDELRTLPLSDLITLDDADILESSLLACSSGVDEVGGFSLCFNPSNAVVTLDRNSWFSSQTGPLPSESYGYNFDLLNQYPCLDNVDVEDILLTITINDFSFNFPQNLQCCESYFSGIFANLYSDCAYGDLCSVIGDGLTNSGTGDCSSSGDQLEYNNGFNLPFTSTVSCLNLDVDEVLGIDIIPNFGFEFSGPAGCGCTQEAITLGHVDIDFDVSLEYIFCEDDLPTGCAPVSFPPIGTVCDDELVFLPASSSEGISGTWDTGMFPDISNAGGTTFTATFTPNSGECSSTPFELDFDVELCCSADAGTLPSNANQSICSSGGQFISLGLSTFTPSGFSSSNGYQFLLVDPNGVIVDDANDLINIVFPENTTTDPIDYCIYGLSYKLGPGLGNIIYGTTTINVGDTNVLEDGDGNPLGNTPSATGNCMDLSSNCVTITVEAPTVAPMADDISTCEGGDTEITPTGNGTNFNFYADAGLMTLLDSGSTYDPMPTGGTTTEIWVTEGSGSCESAATMVTIELIDAPNAGEDSTLNLCSDNLSSVDIFAALNGNPDMGGEWADNTNSLLITNPNSYDFSTYSTGTYIFCHKTTSGILGACPDVVAILTIEIGNPVNAGDDTSISLCSATNTNTNLFASLTGAPDAGGTWIDDNGVGVDISDPTNVDFIGVASGSYEFIYTVTGQGSCTNDGSVLTVVVAEGANAGMDAATGICEGGSTVIDLQTTLGTADTGGIWADVNTTGVDLTDPTNVDFAAVNAGNYTFTYTITGGDCPDAMATVSVAIGAAPDAGEDNSVEVCNASNGNSATVNFSTSLLGSPDNNGSWSDDNSSGVNITDPTNVDFTGIPAGSYQFTYTIIGAGDCPDDNAVLTVNVTQTLYAGEDTSLSICEGDNIPVDFIAAIGGIQDIGGEWTELSSPVFPVDTSDFTNIDVSNLTSGTYIFQYVHNAVLFDCGGDQALLTIVVSGSANAGDDNSIALCSANNTNINLLTSLAGTPDTGGTWTDDNATGVDISDPSNVDFMGLATGMYTFTYSIVGAGNCPSDSAVLTINITQAANAGMDAATGICEGGTTIIDLQNTLGGTPDMGGTWADVNTTGVDLTDATTVDFAAVTAGNYSFTYTVVGGNCPDAMATVSVSIGAAPDPGVNNSVNICEGDPNLMNFYNSLGASPNANGAWSDDNSSGLDISDPNNVDLSGLVAGNYAFTYTITATGDCPGGMATLSIAIEANPSSGVANPPLEICSDVTTLINLADQITGEAMGGVWSESSASPSTGFDAANGTFDPTGQNTASYTFEYAFAANANCPSNTTIVNVVLNAVPSFLETTKECSMDLMTYSVSIQTDGDMLTASEGTVTDNMDGTFTVSGVMTGNDLDVTVTNSTTTCAANFTITAPDCSCGMINAPTGMDVEFCADEPIPALTVSADMGLAVNWYDDASGTNILADNELIYTPTTTGIFYAQAIDFSNNCTSSITPIELTMNSLPTLTENAKACSPDLATYSVTIQTDGNMLTAPEGTVTDNMDGTFTVSGVTTGNNLEVTITNSMTTCSDDFTITAPNCACGTVNAPMGIDMAICEGETIPALTVSVDMGLNVNWYADALGSNLLMSNALNYTPTAAGVFYAQAIDLSNNCTSVFTPVELTINSLPTFMELSKDCSTDLTTYSVMIQTDGDMLTTTTGTVTDNMDGTFTVSGVATGNNLDVTITNSTTTCPVDFTITAPDCACGTVNAPTGMDVEFCEGDAIPVLSASVDMGLAVNWYEDALGMNLLADNALMYTPTTTGTFYAQAIDLTNNCTSDFTPIQLTMNSLPSFTENAKACSIDLLTYSVSLSTDGDMLTASEGTVTDNMDGTFTISGIATGNDLDVTITNSTTTCPADFTITAPDCTCGTINAPTGMDVEFCEGNPIPTLSASADMGLAVNWYEDALGMNLLADNELIYTPTTTGTFYAQAIDLSNNCTSDLTPIQLTMNSLPALTENAKACSPDLATYSVTIQTDGDMLTASEGTVTDNMDGTFTISDILAGNDLDVTITNSTTTCPADFTITAPDCACPVFGDPVISTSCSDNNTPNDDTDDTFSYTIDMASIGLGTTYAIQGDDTQTGLVYGSPTADLGSFLISAGALTIDLVDETNPTCSSIGILIEAPASCSECLETVEAGAAIALNCAITMQNLQGTASSTGQFSWTGPNNFTATENNPSVSEAGMYYLTVNFDNGCVEMDSVLVNLDPSTPNADAGLAQSITCNSPMIELGGMNTSSGSQYAYAWTGPNNYSSTLANPSIDEAGTYSLVVTDIDNNCTSEASEVIIQDETDLPVAIILADPTNIIDCIITSVALSADQNNPESVVYQWQFDDLEFDTPVITANASGTYTLTAIDTITGCQETAQEVVQNNVGYPIIALAPFGALDCINESLMLDASNSQSSTDISYQWTNSNGTTLGTSPEITITDAGTYIFQSIDTSNGCNNDSTIVVTENIDLPTIEAGPDQILDCIDMLTELQGSLTSANTIIEWSPQAGIVSGAMTASPEVNAAAWYYMTASNQDNGCVAVDSVFVEAPEMPQSANLQVSQPGCNSTQQGSLIVQNIIGGTAPYLYTLNDGPLMASPSFPNLDSDTYTLAVEDTNGCVWDTTIVIAESMDIFIDLGDNQQINLGDSLQLNPFININANSLDTIIWTATTNGGISCPNCINPWLSPTYNTNYTVEIIDINGCSSSDEVNILVLQNDDVYIPNAFSPNEDGINEIFTVYSGGNVVNVLSLQVYDYWGNELYQASNFVPDAANTIGWDGQFRGKPMDPNVFIYSATVEFLNGTVQVIKGDFVLMR